MNDSIVARLRDPRPALGLGLGAGLLAAALALASVLFAGAASAATQTEQGESWPDSGGAVQTITSSSLNAPVKAFWANGSTQRSISLAEPKPALRVRADADGTCNGYPRIEISDNGTLKGTVRTDSDSYKVYSVELSSPIPAGARTVRLTYPNDSTSGCDRNVFVDWVEFVGAASPPPPPTTTSPPPPPATAPLFADGFEGRRFDSSGLANPDGSGRTNGLTGGAGAPPWTRGSACDADSVTPSAIARSGAQSARFAVEDDDAAPCTYEPNPRAQLNYGSGASGRFFEGDERYIAFSAYFPSGAGGFTDHGSGQWSQLFNVWGSPYGSTPTAVSMFSDDHPTLAGDRVGVRFGGNLRFSEVLQRDRWHDYEFRVRFSSDPAVGLVEMWKNGAKQDLDGNASDGIAGPYRGRTYWYGASGGVMQVPLYYRHGMGSRSMLYDEVEVGTSTSSVGP